MGLDTALDGRVALVTGSTRGIGRAVAERFADAGAHVVVCGRDAARARRVAEAIPGDHVGVACDVRDPDAVEAAVALAEQRWGRIDIAVNNAAVARDGFVTRVSDEDWHETIATNLTGPFHVSRAAARGMKKAAGGSIVNLLSWSGMRGNVGQVAYSSAKAGLYGMTLTLAKELAKFCIRVNGVCPLAPTDIGAEMPEELRQKALRRIPLKRAGTVDEVADGVLFLVSPAASYITGQVLNLDGGMHLT